MTHDSGRSAQLEGTPNEATRRTERPHVCVESDSMLRITFFVVLPSLLLSPILYYSLTTPFALVDDYGTWYYLSKLDSFSSFFRWVNVSFLHFSDHHERYRPFWEIYNALAWKGFGPTPWAHHLSRWVFHFGAVLTFVAAFRRVSFRRQELGQREGGGGAGNVCCLRRSWCTSGCSSPILRLPGWVLKKSLPCSSSVCVPG